MEINFELLNIKNFYSYRSNRCDNAFRIHNVPFQQIKKYIESQGYTMDNHISWENEQGLCFTYSDHTLYIGTTMLNIKW